LKARLAQQCIQESDLNQAQLELQAGRERLRSLEGEFLQAIWHTVFKKAWERDLDRARGDCLNWLAEINQRFLQLAAQREAANLYDQVVQDAHGLLAQLASLVQTARRTLERLDQFAQAALKPSGLEQGIYELALEAVDDNYIRSYYKQQALNIDLSTAYREFSKALPVKDLVEFSRWNEAELQRSLQSATRVYFADGLEQISLLEALQSYYGDQATTVIEAQFDRLVRYCHPFWQYNRDSGIQGQEGKSIIGVEDEHSELIPARYRDNLQYEVKSTGFRHRIDVARVQHGLPAFLLRGIADYKAYYDIRRKGLDPLHVLPEAADAGEVIPEERQEARQTFAVACACGYIVQIGSWYYFDPQKEYEQRRLHPGKENRLSQGRENAEEAFIQREDFVQQAEGLIEAEFVAMGNRAAISSLGSQVEAYKQALAGMGPETDLRRQYEKEIRALQIKRRQLGFIEQALPLRSFMEQRKPASRQELPVIE
jgi:hypothetical protein